MRTLKSSKMDGSLQIVSRTLPKEVCFSLTQVVVLVALKKARVDGRLVGLELCLNVSGAERDL
jgi:hypothetical protein